MIQASTDVVEQAIRDLGRQQNRVLAGIAGAPGSGKSTFACEMAKRLGPEAAVLPMDGFHLDNAHLERMGLLHRKGAPETFDGESFVCLVKALRTQDVVAFPTFDRQNDCTVADGGCIHATTRYVLIEGNYLLLRTRPWPDLRDLFDLTVFLDVPLEILRSRLVARWLQHGIDAKRAISRAEQNDMKNVQVVLSNSFEADFVVTSIQ